MYVIIDGWALPYDINGVSAIIDALFAFEVTEHRRAIAQDKLGLPVVFKNAKPPSLPTATLKLKINHPPPPQLSLIHI